MLGLSEKKVEILRKVLAYYQKNYPLLFEWIKDNVDNKKFVRSSYEWWCPFYIAEYETAKRSPESGSMCAKGCKVVMRRRNTDCFLYSFVRSCKEEQDIKLNRIIKEIISHPTFNHTDGGYWR